MEFELDNYYLKSINFFSFLSRKEKLLINSKVVRKEYLRGELIFREHSFSKGVYIVRKGKVKIFQTNTDSKENIVYIYKKGEYFGYRPILAGEPHPVSAVAMDNVVISFIPRDVFLNLISSSPDLAKNLLINLTKEFTVWVNKLTVFSQYSVKERVALSLLILNEVYKRDGQVGPSVIAINRDDLAGYVGTAKETVVRMLRVFKDDNVIRSRGSKITIQKFKALESYLTHI